ncbi:MAG: DNA translocase FtsK [Bacteroidales bacterium]|jgi:S-DNA-T family DNA segregation ATPase FtsK/SpoIIIE|nr:DNA translocase FtsK [Bacteroidales bacterium]
MAKGEKAAKTAETRQKGKLVRVVTDERFKMIMAFLFTGIAVFMTVAFVSYLFTWKSDQSFEFSGALSGPSVKNWAGKLGAWASNKMMWKGFGISALFIPLMLLVTGFRLLKVKLLPLGWTFRTSLVGLALFSLLLSFVSGETGGFLGNGLGGAHGIEMVKWFESLLGTFGTGMLLLLLTFAFFTFSFAGFFGWFTATMQQLIARRKGKPAAARKPAKPAAAPSAEDRDDDDDGDGEETAGDYAPDHRELPPDDDIEFQIADSKSDEDAPEAPRGDGGIELTVEPQPQTDDMPETGSAQEAPYDLSELGKYDPTLDLSHYKMPPLELLKDHKSDNSEVSNDELISNKNRIVETLANYKIQIDKIKATIGPTVTLYEIVPAPGVRISKIKNLEDDIALSLSALGIRIIAPMPGKGTIGIEVPNLNPEIVSMRSVIASRRFQETSMDLPIALGKTIANETFVFDLTRMPHLLVAGSTGQGKSVGLNAIISSILYKKHPSQVKLVMVDPKSVEFSPYEKIERHFLAKLPDSEEAIITDTQKVIHTINSLCIEMDTRYSLLKDAQVRNIKEYNNKFIERRLNPNLGHRFLPYIVLVIDEYADLMMTAGKEIEMPIARLAQKARAAGIHLIIATQRPTVGIITGVIKANFPARIAFRVISQIDSRTILDGPGANQLIGRGDLLFTSGGDITRVQCAFIDTPEIEDITKFVGEQQGYATAFPLPEYSPEDNNESKDVDLSKRDDLFNDAARLMVIHQQGSTSLIQRKFSIGYNRAGRIMDQLEAAGIVGPSEGSKARQVLFTDEASLEKYLTKLDQGEG